SPAFKNLARMGEHCPAKPSLSAELHGRVYPSTNIRYRPLRALLFGGDEIRVEELCNGGEGGFASNPNDSERVLLVGAYACLVHTKERGQHFKELLGYSTDRNKGLLLLKENLKQIVKNKIKERVAIVR
ncbi:hypothetical protein HAX54_025045, partial [Datura stramonium]|nr:hypothetical protein [Datura stramonium]